LPLGAKYGIFLKNERIQIRLPRVQPAHSV
jgi:hypothetical protein